MPNKSIDNLGKHENDNWNKDELYFHSGLGCWKFSNCFKCPFKDCISNPKKVLFSNTIVKSSEVII